MTAGILGYGVYIPIYRIKADEYKKAWGSFAATGVSEKSFPGYDEDIITMAIESAENALVMSGIQGEELGAVYCASTSAPYDEKSTAATIAAVLGAHEARTIDFGASTHAGTSAFLAAVDYINAGTRGPVIVIAADAPLAAPDSNTEHQLGAAAAAFVIGSSATIAAVEESYSYARETLGERFRKSGEPYIKDLELRTNYFEEVLQTLITGLLEKSDKTVEAINHVVVQQPDGRRHTRAIAKFKFSREQTELGNLSPSTGDTGVASTLLGLAAVLNKANPDERILVASYGSGAGDAIILLAKKGQSPGNKQNRTVTDYLENKQYVDYMTYLKQRHFLSSAGG
jgi:hydroxymethylglutaryl-CoA synthase